MAEKKSGGCFRILVALCVLMVLLIALFYMTRDTVSGWVDQFAAKTNEVIPGVLPPGLGSFGQGSVTTTAAPAKAAERYLISVITSASDGEEGVESVAKALLPALSGGYFIEAALASGELPETRPRLAIQKIDGSDDYLSRLIKEMRADAGNIHVVVSVDGGELHVVEFAAAKDATRKTPSEEP